MKKNITKTTLLSVTLTTALTASAFGYSGAANPLIHPPANDDVASRIQNLEHELQLLKQNQANLEKANRHCEEVRRTDEAISKNTVHKKQGDCHVGLRPPRNDGFTTSYSEKGIQFTDSKKNLFRIGGHGHLDGRYFAKKENTNLKDDLVLRSARINADAQFNDQFAARFSVDFGNGETKLVDAYADYKPASAVNLRAGKFKTPIGLERWKSEQESIMVERGLANNFVPFRDTGVQVYGSFLDKAVEYQIALTNGATDLAGTDKDIDSSKEVTARIFTSPFLHSGIEPLQGLGVGFAASTGNRKASSTENYLPESYRSSGGSKIFTYNTGVTADNEQTRFNPQLYYTYGPVELLSEYVQTKQGVNNAGVKDDLTHSGLTAIAGVFVTGEKANFAGVNPLKNFSLTGDGWGALELTARYGQAKFDKDSFASFADTTKSVKEAQEWGAGLTWYLNEHLRVYANYIHTTFEGGAATGNRDDEHAFLTRTQFRF